jgi:hypothetical protein
MKKNIFLFCTLALSFKLHSQSVRITVNERKNENVIPVIDKKFTIVFNDTIIVELTSGSDGQLGKIQMDEGMYKIVIKNEEFIDAVENSVKLSPGKVTALNVTCSRKNTKHENKK